jgi:uncharacterized membrane protein
MSKFEFDWQIAERRNSIMLVISLMWLAVPVGYFYRLFTFSEVERTTHLEFVSSIIPQEIGIMVLLWPFYAMFLGVGLTYAILRIIFRLIYGKWV